MDDFALKKPRHRLESHVGMWGDIHGLAIAERQRPEAVEETPRAHEASLPDGECSRDRERTQAELTVWIGFDPCVVGAERHARFGGDPLGSSRHAASIVRRVGSSKATESMSLLSHTRVPIALDG